MFEPQGRYAVNPPSTVDRVDDRAAMAWPKARRQPGDTILVSVSSIPAVRWYASMAQLRPGWFVRAVPPGPDCTPNLLIRHIANHHRILAYSGIRTNAETPTVLEARLTEQGQILERQEFDTGIVWLVQVTAQPKRAAPTLPGVHASCLQPSPFGNR